MEKDMFEITIEDEIKTLYEAILDEVYNKYTLYTKKFYEQPKFIKLPELLYMKLFHFQETLKEIYGRGLDIDFEHETLFEMFICETPSINFIDEIEVF